MVHNLQTATTESSWFSTSWSEASSEPFSACSLEKIRYLCQGKQRTCNTPGLFIRIQSQPLYTNATVKLIVGFLRFLRFQMTSQQEQNLEWKSSKDAFTAEILSIKTERGSSSSKGSPSSSSSAPRLVVSVGCMIDSNVTRSLSLFGIEPNGDRDHPGGGCQYFRKMQEILCCSAHPFFWKRSFFSVLP